MVTIPPIKMVMAGGWFMTSHAFNQSNMRLAFSLTAGFPRWRLIWWSQQCDMLFFFTVVCPKHGHLSGIMINPLSTSAKNEKTAAKTGAAQNLSIAIFTWNRIECVEGLMIPQTSAFYKWMFIAVFLCAVPAPALEEPLWHRQDLHLHGADSDCPELRWTNCTSPIHSVLWAIIVSHGAL